MFGFLDDITRTYINIQYTCIDIDLNPLYFVDIIDCSVFTVILNLCVNSPNHSNNLILLADIYVVYNVCRYTLYVINLAPENAKISPSILQ